MKSHLFLQMNPQNHTPYINAAPYLDQYNFSNPEYDMNFDIFLHNEVGYEKIRNLDQGMFLNSYSINSLSEYFATSFEEYYLKNRRIVEKITPAVFLKINSIHQGEIEYDHQT